MTKMIDIEYEYIHQTLMNYIGLPEAKALVPVNPMRLPSYVGGSILSQDLAKSTNVVSKPWDNLKVTYNYVGLDIMLHIVLIDIVKYEWIQLRLT